MYKIHFLDCNKTLNYPTNSKQNLLFFAEEQGVILPRGCTNGYCGKCEVKLISGRVKTLDEQKELGAGDIIKLCQAVALQDCQIDEKS